ncbi:MAG: hypothetical protein ACOC92_02410 [bacterium]
MRWIVFGIVGLSLPLPSAALAEDPPGSPGPPEPPDLRKAERELERARSELEEIVGSRLLRQDAPALPEVPSSDLSPEESSFLDRLVESPPGDWTSGERERLAELLAGETTRLSAATSRGEAVSMDQLASRALGLLQPSRLLVLRDRLAFAEGREGELVDGLADRLDLATRLWLQPGVVGALAGGMVHLRALQDVQLLAVEPTASREALERLDALLLRWRLEVPDPAAVVAREGLLTTDYDRFDAEYSALVPDEAAYAVFAAPLARDLAELARRCRDDGCRAAVEAIENRFSEDDDPYRMIARMMLPNLLDGVRKLTGTRELTHLAQAAVALRLEALELEGYPEDLERIAARLGLAPEEAETLVYERHPDGGATLRFASDRIVSETPERRRDLVRPLVAWDLPPV